MKTIYYDVHKQSDEDLHHHVLVMFKDLNLLRRFDIDEKKLDNFVREITKQYIPDAPYHNKLHAFDVCHFSYVLITLCEASKYLSKMDELCLLISALAHDAGHDGFNNEFHNKLGSNRAIMYAFNGAQENYSNSILVRTLRKEGCDILCSMNVEDQERATTKMVKMILQTDAKCHFKLMEDFSIALDSQQLTAGFLATVLLHLADVSNPVRPEGVMMRWASKTQKEFFRQGDREKELGWVISPFMDRSKNESLAAMEMRFIDYVVEPAFHTVADFLPTLEVFCERALAKNRQAWKVRDVGKRGRRTSVVGGRRGDRPNFIPGLPSPSRMRKQSVVINGVRSKTRPSIEADTMAHIMPPATVTGGWAARGTEQIRRRNANPDRVKVIEEEEAIEEHAKVEGLGNKNVNKYRM